MHVLDGAVGWTLLFTIFNRLFSSFRLRFGEFCLGAVLLFFLFGVLFASVLFFFFFFGWVFFFFGSGLGFCVYLAILEFLEKRIKVGGQNRVFLLRRKQ